MCITTRKNGCPEISVMKQALASTIEAANNVIPRSGKVISVAPLLAPIIMLLLCLPDFKLLMPRMHKWYGTHASMHLRHMYDMMSSYMHNACLCMRMMCVCFTPCFT